MAVENIVIGFDSDLTGLQPTVDALLKLGAITQKQVDDFNKANTAAQAHFQKTAATIDKTTGSIDKLNKASKDISKNITAGSAKETFDKLGNTIEATTNKVVSLKTQLREMKSELALMEDEGRSFSEKFGMSFDQLALKAAKFEDQIGDTQARIRALASDTRYIDATLQAVTGLAAGFSILQGASALFGKENEDVQKALLKVQAAMAILNGLQQITIVLQKESALRAVAYSSALKIVQLVSRQTGLSMAASWALATGGLSLLITGVAVLVTSLSSASDETENLEGSTKDLTKATKDQNDELERQKTLMETLAKFGRDKVETEQIFGLINRGASLAKISTSELNDAISELKQEVQDFTGEGLFVLFDPDKPLTKEQIVEFKKIRREENEQRKVAIGLIEQEIERRSKNASTIKDETLAIILENQRRAEAVQQDVYNKGQQDEQTLNKNLFDIRKKSLNDQIALFKVGSMARTKLENDLFILSSNYDKQGLDQRKKTLDTDLKALENQRMQKSISEQQFAYKSYVLQLKYYDQQLDLYKNDSDRYELLLNEKLKLMENFSKAQEEIQKNETEAIKASVQMMLAMYGMFTGSQSEGRQRNLEAEMLAIQTITTAYTDMFQILADQRDYNLEKDIASSELMADQQIMQQDRLVKAKLISEEQYNASVEQIGKQNQQRQKLFQHDEAVRAKNMALFQIGINTALAVISALTSVPPNVPLSIANAAAGLSAAAVVAAKPIPLAKGTEEVKGGTPGKDSVHALLMPKERVVSADINKHLAGIKNEDLPQLAAVHRMMGNIPLQGDVAGQPIGVGNVIDYRLLAKELGKEISKIPRSGINLTENGFKAWVRQGDNETTYLNNRYRYDG